MHFNNHSPASSNQLILTLTSTHHSNSTVDCGTPPLPLNGSLLQLHTNTTEGSVVVFQCDPGFVPEGEMTAVCGRNGQWTPSPDVTCSPRPTQTFTQTFTQIFTQVSILTPGSTPSGPGKVLLWSVYITRAKAKYNNYYSRQFLKKWVTNIIQSVHGTVLLFHCYATLHLS